MKINLKITLAIVVIAILVNIGINGHLIYKEYQTQEPITKKSVQAKELNINIARKVTRGDIDNPNLFKDFGHNISISHPRSIEYYGFTPETCDDLLTSYTRLIDNEWYISDDDYATLYPYLKRCSDSNVSYQAKAQITQVNPVVWNEVIAEVNKKNSR